MAQVYLIIAFLLAIGVAVFAIQNSTPVQVRLFLWQFQSTLVQIILSSAAIGAVVAFLLGLPRSIRRGWRLREQDRYIRESGIREALGTIIVAIKKASGSMVFNPPPEIQMEAGDMLIALGEPDNLKRLELLAGG